VKVRPRTGPIALVGLRATGKSTLGKALAEQLGRAFTDLDEHVVELHTRLEGEPPATSAGELFTALGADGYRAREWASLRAVLGAKGSEHVLATGGGVVETAACRDLLGKARCVWLKVPLDELARRVSEDPTDRPALTGGADPVGEIPLVAERRESWYREVAWRELDLTGLDFDAALEALVLAVRD
jgi:shikimate kinase